MGRGKSEGVVIGIALALASCGKSEVRLAEVNPIALINSGDAKACAHPAVLDVLRGLIGTPKGDETGLILPVGAAEISKMTLPPFTVDMITLASVDMSVKRLTCRATSKMSADIGGPTQHFEKEIVYVVSPSAADDKEFIVSTDASIAADRVNIAIVKEIARGVRQAQADEAAQQRLKAALESAGATEPVKAVVAASAPKESAASADAEESYSAEYNRCMDASGGVTVEMRDCNDPRTPSGGWSSATFLRCISRSTTPRRPPWLFVSIAPSPRTGPITCSLVATCPTAIRSRSSPRANTQRCSSVASPLFGGS